MKSGETRGKSDARGLKKPRAADTTRADRRRTLSHLWQTRLPRTPGPTTRRLRLQVFFAAAAATTWPARQTRKDAGRRAAVGDKRVVRDDSERAEPRPLLVECLREGVVMAQRAVAKTLLCMMPTLGIVGKGVAACPDLDSGGRRFGLRNC